MRLSSLFVLCLVACDGSANTVDAQVTDAVNTAPIDAKPDAPSPDAPSPPDPAIVAACMHACDAVTACFDEQPDPSCNAECAADLADCTPQQVQDVDACAQLTCDPNDLENSPLLQCLITVACVMG